MADFLALDLNKFQNQMVKFIEIYYNLLKEEKDEPLTSLKEDSIKWKNQIIKLLEDKYPENSPKGLKSRKESIKEYLNEATKKNKINMEFYMILDIVEFLYETYFDKKIKKIEKKSNEHIMKHMARCIYRELIELRNKLGHDENPSYEYILRFYEDQYYLIKFMKPANAKVDLSDYIIKDIKINIHLYLSKNFHNENSFELEPLKEEFIKFEELNKIVDYRANKNIIINNNAKDIESLFEFTPLKLKKYEFSEFNKQIDANQNNNINSNTSINKNDNDEEKEIYGQNDDTDNNSRNSISGYLGSNISASSSERYSINENDSEIGNIKKEDENITKLSMTDIQERF